MCRPWISGVGAVGLLLWAAVLPGWGQKRRDELPPEVVHAGVEQALVADAILGRYPIVVLVRSDGAVMLSGVLPSQKDRERATGLTKDVPGVFGIRNRIVVDRRAELFAPPPRTAPEEQPPLAATQPAAPAVASKLAVQMRIQQALSVVPSLAAVNVKAYRGVIALTGVVSAAAAKRHAGELAKRAAGAIPVDTQIQVVPAGSVERIVF